MANEVKAFIETLRAGKSSGEAYASYCFALLVLPIHKADLERLGDPFACGVASFGSYAEAMGADAFDEGADDAAIAKAFNQGLARDAESGIIYRTMRKEERPTFGEQLRWMSTDDQMWAAKFFGLNAVARAIAGAA